MGGSHKGFVPFVQNRHWLRCEKYRWTSDAVFKSWLTLLISKTRW